MFVRTTLFVVGYCPVLLVALLTFRGVFSFGGEVWRQHVLHSTWAVANVLGVRFLSLGTLVHTSPSTVRIRGIASVSTAAVRVPVL